jgi:hypothetical protein
MFLPASALMEDEKEEAPAAEGIDILFQEGYPGDTGAAADGWFSKAGVTAPDRMENRTQTKALFSFIASLPRLLMLVLAAVILAKESVRRARAASARAAALRENRITGSGPLFGTIFRAYSGASLFALFALGFLLLAGTGARLPPAFIPSRWSDLGFWPGLLQRFLSDAAERALRGAARRELVTGNLSALACLTAILALPAVWFSCRAYRQSAYTAHGVMALGACLWTPAAILFAPAAALFTRRIGLTPGVEDADLWMSALFAVVCSLNFPGYKSALRAAGRVLTPRRYDMNQEEST